MSGESKVGRRGRDRFNLEEDREIREWCKANGVTEDQVRDAVREIQDFMTTLEILVDHGDRTPTGVPRARHGGKRATAIRRGRAAGIRRGHPGQSAGHGRSHRGT